MREMVNRKNSMEKAKIYASKICTFDCRASCMPRTINFIVMI